MIKHASHADIDQIMTLCQTALKASPTWCGIGEDLGHARANLEQMILSVNHSVWVLEQDRRIVGVLVGATAGSWWHTGREASDLLFYVLPGHRGHGMKLLQRFIDWAEGFPDLKQIYVSVSFGGEEAERTEQLYNRRFTRIGGNYIVKRGDT